ncbi:MAG: GIY-YIG nuclease family protein [Chlorobiota bacterium]
MNQQSYIYIMASQKNGTIYTGVTSDLYSRVWQHKNKIFKGFTAKYNVNMLVYYEEYGRIEDAIQREKQIKGWSRKKKTDLIEKENYLWEDLSEGWY